MACSSTKMTVATPATTLVETLSLPPQEDSRQGEDAGKDSVTPAKLFHSGSPNDDEYELHVTTTASRPRKRSSNTSATTTLKMRKSPKHAGGVWADGRDAIAYENACSKFKNMNLEDRTRARAVHNASHYRPQSVMELIGAQADQLVVEPIEPVRATDPHADYYEAIIDEWECSNLVKSQRRIQLMAKLDPTLPDYGTYYPSMSVLEELEPHMDQERVCPNEAAGCRVVGKPSRRHTCKFTGNPKKNVVVFQESRPFAQK